MKFVAHHSRNDGKNKTAARLQAAIEPLEARTLLSTYIVNTTSDAASPGPGNLTLRQAITNANSRTGADTITFSSVVFQAGSLHTIALTRGQLALTDKSGATTITGPGAGVLAISGGGVSRVFNVAASVSAAVSGLTIINGKAAVDSTGTARGGGIFNAGSLSLNAVNVSQCSAKSSLVSITPGKACGGGIYSSGSLALQNSTITGNKALGTSNVGTNNGYPYAVYRGGAANGGGIYSSGPLVISSCTISQNTATGGDADIVGGVQEGGPGTIGGGATGGGIYGGGNVSITASTVSGNMASGGNAHAFYMSSSTGGSALAAGLFSGGALSITSSTFSDNCAAGGTAQLPAFGTGGDASGGAVYGSTTADISSSTFTSNSVAGGELGGNDSSETAGTGRGGAIYGIGSITIQFCTVTKNTATGGKALTWGSGGNAYGGGVFGMNAAGAVSSTFSQNVANAGQSAAAIDGAMISESKGGGLYCSTTLTLTQSTISNNTARSGGGPVRPESSGVACGGGAFVGTTATITQSSIIANTAIGASAARGELAMGGGLYTQTFATLSSSTIAANTALGGSAMGEATLSEVSYPGGDAQGGGLWTGSNGAIITNCTIANNTAAGGNAYGEEGNPYGDEAGGAGIGGGIFGGQSIKIFDTTISGNITKGGTGFKTGAAVGGGMSFTNFGVLLDNSIISANKAGSAFNDISGAANASSANNLIGIGGGLANGVNGNKVGVTNPKLSPLGSYDGPTQTMLPLAGSPAIDAGSNALIPAGVTTDQRGMPRIFGKSVDIGAVEYILPALTGSVFNDHNANGIKDGTDAGISGRTVFIDANLNGTQDTGETSTLTDANGDFSFGLQAGTYRIIAINPANWKTTAPAAGFINVTVAAGQTIFAGSFGSVHLSTITGTFFNDANSNGWQDSGETGLSGQKLFLDTNNNGTLDAGETSVSTDASGNFSFSGLIPGTYHVRAIMPSGSHPTIPSTGKRDITLYAGQLISGILFGAAQTQTGAAIIRGSVFNDHNANGIKDAADAGISGRTVFIDGNLNGTLDAGETSTLTDASGNFSFTKLQPGTYRIIAINPTNWNTTTPAAGFVDVTVAVGQTVSAGSFGSVHLSTISGTFFNDANSNGLPDSGEVGLSGQNLFLDTNNNGSLNVGEKSVTTDGSGNFSFTGLIPGTYHVRAIVPSGFQPTIPSTGKKDIILYAGQLISGNLFGAVKTPTGIITGEIYNDSNHDGDCDAGEVGLAGWQAYVDTNNDGAWNANEPIATADAGGRYTLVLAAGNYRIREIRQGNWTRTQPTGDWPLGYYDVTLAAGQTIGGRDFGNYLPPTEIQQLGGNLNHPSDRVQDHPFVDLVKTTRGFYNLAGRLASNGEIDFATTDANGWPTEDFCFSAADNSEWAVSLAPGVYHMSFAGPVGTVVSVRRDAPNPAALVPQGTPIPTLAQIGFDDATSTYTYDVTVPTGALVLAFDFQDTQGQVRDIKVLQPGYDISNYPTFRTEYLNLLRDLGPSVLRMMDWTHTNNNPEVDWADRPKVTDATQAKASVPGGLQPLKGVAWEYCIDLANTLHTDLWVNVPAHATDDYISQLATLLRQTLDPTLNIYVEYSNEVWNSGSEQCGYNKNAAGAEVVAAAKAGTSSDLNYDRLAVDTTKPDGGANVTSWADRRVARQLKTISDIFKTVWTAAGLASPINKRVRPILCSQFSNASRFDNMLKFISTVYGAPSSYFYGIGIGCYLDLGRDAAKDGLTKEQVLTDLQNDANAYLTNGAFDGIERRAQQWGLSMDAYEGGVDTYGSTSIAAKAQASLDPRMQDILTGFMTTWFAKGGDLFNYFTLSARSFNSPYGTYAITDDINNLNEPKELAFKAVREELLEND